MVCRCTFQCALCSLMMVSLFALTNTTFCAGERPDRPRIDITVGKHAHGLDRSHLLRRTSVCPAEFSESRTLAHSRLLTGTKLSLARACTRSRHFETPHSVAILL